MIITIFGPPGSGKGTQSSLLKVKYNLRLVSIGNLLRDIISSGAELGENIKSTVESGNLIQDEVICKLFCDQLTFVGRNFLIDGFPRNLNQARFLTQVLQEKYSRDVDIVIELQLDTDVAISRLNGRIICLDCKNIYSLLLSSFNGTTCTKCKSTRLEKRVDDTNMSAIYYRIKEYYFHMKGLRDYYSSRLLAVNANLKINEVANEIESKISCDLV